MSKNIFVYIFLNATINGTHQREIFDFSQNVLFFFFLKNYEIGEIAL